MGQIQMNIIDIECVMSFVELLMSPGLCPLRISIITKNSQKQNQTCFYIETMKTPVPSVFAFGPPSKKFVCFACTGS